MSATVDLARLRKQLRNKRALAMGASLQFVVLPFLGFLSVKAAGMSNYDAGCSSIIGNWGDGSKSRNDE